TCSLASSSSTQGTSAGTLQTLPPPWRLAAPRTTARAQSRLPGLRQVQCNGRWVWAATASPDRSTRWARHARRRRARLLCPPLGRQANNSLSGRKRSPGWQHALIPVRFPSARAPPRRQRIFAPQLTWTFHRKSRRVAPVRVLSLPLLFAAALE